MDEKQETNMLTKRQGKNNGRTQSSKKTFKTPKTDKQT